MVYTGYVEEVGYHSGGDGAPVRLLFRLTGVGEIWHDGCGMVSQEYVE
jgi:hypothetical protein